MKNVPEQIIINGVKYVREPEPEVEYEPDRLVYYWDDGTERRDIAEVYKGIEGMHWDNIEPVNRRWDELDRLDREMLAKAWAVDIATACMFYKDSYNLITGEPHP